MIKKFGGIKVKDERKNEQKNEQKNEITIEKLTVSEQNEIHGGMRRASAGDKSAGTHDSTDCCGCVCA